MIHTPSPRRVRRWICAAVGHFLRVNDSRGYAVAIPFRARWRFAGSGGHLAGCRFCGEIWNDLPQEYKVPMREIGVCRKCDGAVYASTKDGRVFAECSCAVTHGVKRHDKLKPIVNGTPR